MGVINHNAIIATTWHEGDTLRNIFIETLATSNFDDGSSPWEWVEVSYGEYGQSIVRGNNVDCFF